MHLNFNPIEAVMVSIIDLGQIVVVFILFIGFLELPIDQIDVLVGIIL